MSAIVKVLDGVIHGKTIELNEAPGLADGQPVRITLETPPSPDAKGATFPKGEGLRRAFGSWSDDAEGLDEFLADIRRRRKIPRREIEP